MGFCSTMFVLKFGLVWSCLVYLSLAQTFTGSWTDQREGGGYGGLLYMCQRGDLVFGAYSEVGLMVGDKNGNTIAGTWVEGGYTVSSCKAGLFFLALSDDGNIFSGWWSCNDDDNDTQYDWAEERVSTTRPTIEQCAELVADDDADNDIKGFWIDPSEQGMRAICSSGDEYQSSYFYVDDDADDDGNNDP